MEAMEPTQVAAVDRPAQRKRQAAVLTARYWAATRGDWKSLLLLMAQAPLIGWMCTIVWGSIESDTPSLYFVLSLSAVWFGCIGACREIIKERAIVERERFFGLSMTAYVASKYAILAALGLVQVLLLQMTVEWRIALNGPFLLQTVALWGAYLCGTGLGLLVSAIAARQERAVWAVPVLIIPQILFSEFAIPEELFGDLMAAIEKLIPVRWSYRVFVEAAAPEPAWLDAVAPLGVLFVYALVLGGATSAALLRRREI